MKQDLSSSFYKRQGMSNNSSKIRQSASSTARILTYVYQTMKLMSNVSHSIPLLELSVSLNHRGCWRLLWHMAGPQTVCPGISQTILILFLPTRLVVSYFLLLQCSFFYLHCFTCGFGFHIKIYPWVPFYTILFSALSIYN